jgi:hypothetical protein
VASQVTGYVWIESGYTWLLWGGGIPLLLSFVWFVRTTVGHAWYVARNSVGPGAVAGGAAFAAVAVVTVLMLFDPHLTYRGSADLLFTLIALTEIGRRNLTGSESQATTHAYAIKGAP